MELRTNELDSLQQNCNKFIDILNTYILVHIPNHKDLAEIKPQLLLQLRAGKRDEKVLAYIYTSHLQTGLRQYQTALQKQPKPGKKYSLRYYEYLLKLQITLEALCNLALQSEQAFTKHPHFVKIMRYMLPILRDHKKLVAETYRAKLMNRSHAKTTFNFEALRQYQKKKQRTIKRSLFTLGMGFPTPFWKKPGVKAKAKWLQFFNRHNFSLPDVAAEPSLSSNSLKMF